MHYNLSRRKHIKKKSIPAAIRKIRRNQRLLSCCGFLLTTLWLVLQRLVPVQIPIIYQLLLVIILDGEQSKLKQLSFFFSPLIQRVVFVFSGLYNAFCAPCLRAFVTVMLLCIRKDLYLQSYFTFLHVQRLSLGLNCSCRS